MSGNEICYFLLRYLTKYPPNNNNTIQPKWIHPNTKCNRNVYVHVINVLFRREIINAISENKENPIIIVKNI